MSSDPVFVAVQKRGVITIPLSMRRHLNLDEPGAQVEIIEREGEIVLRPHIAIPADQAWFWTDEWQAMEREVDQEVVAHRVVASHNVDELFAELDT
jgi:AbrB family looped-hinge helix DNA binding protein